MASSLSFHQNHPLSFLLHLLLHTTTLVAAAFDSESQRHMYIVHASETHMPTTASFSTHNDWYISTLASVRSVDVEDMVREHANMYTFTNLFHGFTAMLTKSQAAALEQIPGFTTFPDRRLKLHTTRTPQFLNLTTASTLWEPSHYQDDVIVGFIDTGLAPDSASFNDRGLREVPARWKGKCEEGQDFSASFCNKKLIGARAFYKGFEAQNGPINQTEGYKSARDCEGHGTHTSSIAVGSYVYNADFLGYATGTARGIAPGARIAMYKVCWKGFSCTSSDVLAGMESAVADGVDIISISLGYEDGYTPPYYDDPVAIGAFAAIQKGIFVSCSAGNSGPDPLTVSNVAPWMLTVAASTIDRNFPSPVTLGNGATYGGVSLYSGKGLDTQQLPLVYGRDAALHGNSSANMCLPGTLDPQLVANKIVLCDLGVTGETEKGTVVQQAGAAAMVLVHTAKHAEDLTATAFLLPATLVSFKSGVAIKAYTTTTKNPTATITFQGTELGTRPAPLTAAFSSRGPNPRNPDILKPDISAPGVNILGAWPRDIGPTGETNDNRHVEFNILSGTSMACPHVTGLAALLRGARPDWSPAAIKSALMTTATDTDNSGGYMLDSATSNLSTPLSHGAGHVNFDRALNPGLIYDLTVEDYVDFLCGSDYNETTLKVLTVTKYKCSSSRAPATGLNYPSFSMVFDQSDSTEYYSATVWRTVTNVGNPRSIYTVTVNAPPGVDVTVVPQKLGFAEINERLSYKITFSTSPREIRGEQRFEASFGDLVWRDGVHSVRSPIVCIWARGSNFEK